MASVEPGRRLRWTLAEEGPAALFADETALGRHVGTGEYSGLEFLHVNAASFINRVPPASQMPFRHTINAYRGCSHRCLFCFARPTHEFLGFNIGKDFETKIVVKINAVERLRAELRSSKWHNEWIAMGTNTDPYQHAEGKYHLTRGIIEVLGEARNPFSILTKSTLILRDLTRLADIAKTTEVRVDFSVGTLDREVWKLTEGGAPPPEKRLEAVRRINEAGVPCGVLVAPVLPGLSDGTDQITEVVEAALAAGAVSIGAVPLHLRPGVKEHYMSRLKEARPDLVALHQRRFAGGAYQPKEHQDQIKNLVTRIISGSPADRTTIESRYGVGQIRNRSSRLALEESIARHPAQGVEPSARQLRLL